MELMSMCQSVTADGSLDNREIAELAKWVERNQHSTIPAVGFLRPIVQEIIRDRKVTTAERAELYKVIEKILPPELRIIAQMRKKEAVLRAKEAVSQVKAAERAEREANTPQESFDFMVAGTLYEGRPEVIRACVHPGMDVLIFREPSNPFSRNACQIHAGRGAMIGFVPEVDAEELAAEHHRVACTLPGGSRNGGRPCNASQKSAMPLNAAGRSTRSAEIDSSTPIAARFIIIAVAP
jgi:hypothetical protein